MEVLIQLNARELIIEVADRGVGIRPDIRERIFERGVTTKTRGREEFDELKPRIDWSMVESFPFLAAFEEQQYIGDEGKIHVYSWDGRQETTLVGPYSVRELYLEHFGE